MQISQPRPILFDETGEAVSNKPLETVVAIGDATRALPDEQVLPEPGSLGDAPEKVLAPPRAHRPLTLPPWPTSQPGPEVTAPSPGQRLVHYRTDQVMYDCYDQERGRPGIVQSRSLLPRTN
jgi:hypothetical protein